MGSLGAGQLRRDLSSGLDLSHFSSGLKPTFKCYFLSRSSWDQLHHCRAVICWEYVFSVWPHMALGLFATQAVSCTAPGAPSHG